MKSDQDKANEAFIDKIKTINIGSGKSDPSQPPNCTDCGKPMMPVAVIPVGMVKINWADGYRKGRKLPSDEQSFSA